MAVVSLALVQPCYSVGESVLVADLGCGVLRVGVAMLQHGWPVLVADLGCGVCSVIAAMLQHG